MAGMWERVKMVRENGEVVEAQAPVVVSASRATDIPAFYADWFMGRLHKGYVRWRNPFSGVPSYVSFAKTRFVVFWSKNPEPMMRHLEELDRLGLGYYFQYTLNDYVAEGFEPNVPAVEVRVETFRTLSERLGKERVVWRFDPLLITERTPPEALLKKVEALGERLVPFTKRLIFSFADIEAYGRVAKNLERAGIAGAREFTAGEKRAMAEALAGLNRSHGWGLELQTCSEDIDLEAYGIGHSRCVDDRIIIATHRQDEALMRFLGVMPGREAPMVQGDLFGFGQGGLPVEKEAPNYRKVKDGGQRKACGCIRSKDIGEYNTCPHRCLYCYANASPDFACGRAQNATRGESICG